MYNPYLTICSDNFRFRLSRCGFLALLDKINGSRVLRLIDSRENPGKISVFFTQRL